MTTVLSLTMIGRVARPWGLCLFFCCGMSSVFTWVDADYPQSVIVHRYFSSSWESIHLKTRQCDWTTLKLALRIICVVSFPEECKLVSVCKTTTKIARCFRTLSIWLVNTTFVAWHWHRRGTNMHSRLFAFYKVCFTTHCAVYASANNRRRRYYVLGSSVR